jgi:hypothetical protein
MFLESHIQLPSMQHTKRKEAAKSFSIPDISIHVEPPQQAKQSSLMQMLMKLTNFEAVKTVNSHLYLFIHFVFCFFLLSLHQSSLTRSHVPASISFVICIFILCGFLAFSDFFWVFWVLIWWLFFGCFI